MPHIACYPGGFLWDGGDQWKPPIDTFSPGCQFSSHTEHKTKNKRPVYEKVRRARPMTLAGHRDIRSAGLELEGQRWPACLRLLVTPFPLQPHPCLSIAPFVSWYACHQGPHEHCLFSSLTGGDPCVEDPPPPRPPSASRPWALHDSDSCSLFYFSAAPFQFSVQVVSVDDPQSQTLCSLRAFPACSGQHATRPALPRDISDRAHRCAPDLSPPQALPAGVSEACQTEPSLPSPHLPQRAPRCFLPVGGSPCLLARPHSAVARIPRLTTEPRPLSPS